MRHELVQCVATNLSRGDPRIEARRVTETRELKSEVNVQPRRAMREADVGARWLVQSLSLGRATTPA